MRDNIKDESLLFKFKSLNKGLTCKKQKISYELQKTHNSIYKENNI